MATIKAPFNFVPLSEEVVFPEWANQVSQDIPFEASLSGKIDVEVEAKTPIFVRNGHKPVSDKMSEEYRTQKQSEEYRSFSKTPDGHYFIPATSIKGELRHLVEILSFSKMRVDDKRYGIRDLNNKPYREALPYDSIHCGWMTIGLYGNIEISDHGLPLRISHKVIDDHFGTQFCELFGERALIKDENRTAEYKYRKSPANISTNVFTFSRYKLYPSNWDIDKRIGVKFNEEGDFLGRIVFTGQPGNRKERHGEVKASGKFFEFVFEEVENPQIYRIKEDSTLFRDFEFIYNDSSDWNFWKGKAKRGGRIPVFFQIQDGKISSIGLSFLYKLPFPKRVKGYMPEKHLSPRRDMAECIFGAIDSKDSLRGRVNVSHAFCTEETEFIGDHGETEISPYLGSPKPTYYPIYLEQVGEDGEIPSRGRFKTMMDLNARIRGWKMYPSRGYLTDFLEVDESQLENTNPAIPLGEGSKFHFSIHFHNLKREELGALLYALQPQKKSCHSIGFAKAYGYGTCSYLITGVYGFKMDEMESIIGTFKSYMETHIPDYMKTPQIRELLAMLNPENAQRLRRPLEYMVLEDFVGCKRHNPNGRPPKIGQFLPPYSTLVKPKEITPTTSTVFTAQIDFLSPAVKQAHLTEGKDHSKKLLDMNGKDVKREKLKIGDFIIVELIKNGKELRYKSKK